MNIFDAIESFIHHIEWGKEIIHGSHGLGNLFSHDAYINVILWVTQSKKHMQLFEFCIWKVFFLLIHFLILSRFDACIFAVIESARDPSGIGLWFLCCCCVEFRFYQFSDVILLVLSFNWNRCLVYREETTEHFFHGVEIHWNKLKTSRNCAIFRCLFANVNTNPSLLRPCRMLTMMPF